MRQGPSNSATLYEAGTRRKGNDGNMWKIVITKTGVHRWQKVTRNTSRPNGDMGTLFVFYKTLDPNNWRGKPKLATKWWWVGSGGTRDINYPNEEQYTGPKVGLTKTKDGLTEYYTKLKKQGKVLRFKIRTKYPSGKI